VKAFFERIIPQLLLLMLPLVALFLLVIVPFDGEGRNDFEDRFDFVMLLNVPFAALFLIIFGRAIFSTIQTIVARKPIGTPKSYWLGSAFVLFVWLGLFALSLVA
jgi:hypothetical protein